MLDNFYFVCFQFIKLKICSKIANYSLADIEFKSESRVSLLSNFICILNNKMMKKKKHGDTDRSDYRGTLCAKPFVMWVTWLDLHFIWGPLRKPLQSQKCCTSCKMMSENQLYACFISHIIHIIFVGALLTTGLTVKDAS